eukprot:9370835-Alexandrium_andersonii.AAC.1
MSASSESKGMRKFILGGKGRGSSLSELPRPYPPQTSSPTQLRPRSQGLRAGPRRPARMTVPDFSQQLP